MRVSAEFPDPIVAGATRLGYVDAAELGSLFGEAGRKYKIVSAVLRNNGGGGSYFQPINDGTAHEPQNVDSCITGAGASGVITVNYPTIAAARVVTWLMGPDEVYAKQGITLGASVGLDHADIYVYQSRNYSDEIHWDGSQWVRSSTSTFSPFLVASFTSGVLRLTHADIGSENPYAVSLTPAGTTYRTVINGTVNGTEVNLSFVDSSGNVVTTADTNMKVHVTRPQFRPLQVSPQPLQGGIYTNSNIWLCGIFRV